jgi:hypothetical protein
MLERAKGYGYKKIGFILDRGYFSKENIHYMDQCKYDFIIMMKGMKELAAQAIEECAGRFEKNRKNRITEYNVSGMTIKKRLFPSDEKERYFHVYYNDWKAASEREEFEKKLDKISRFLKKCGIKWLNIVITMLLQPRLRSTREKLTGLPDRFLQMLPADL